MSGLLSVIEGNPRRKRRKKSHRKAKARRPRRHRVHARAANPHHRRRRASHHRRHRNPARRRRHHNPLLSGGVVSTLIKGATLGLGVVAANATTAAVNHFGFNGTMAGPAKLALKAGVGVGGWFALKKLGQGKFANAFLLGAGIAVALDAYDQFVKPMLVGPGADGKPGIAPWLADYDYGSLQGYRSGMLQGWAPQSGLQGWAPQTGLSDDTSAYGDGAYS